MLMVFFNVELKINNEVNFFEFYFLNNSIWFIVQIDVDIEIQTYRYIDVDSNLIWDILLLSCEIFFYMVIKYNIICLFSYLFVIYFFYIKVCKYQ